MSESNRELILNRISHRTKILQDNAYYIADTCSSIAEILAISIKSGNKLMFCGNGGSAAESQHMAAEYCATLDHHKPREGMPAIALTTDTSLITAWANDFGFEGVFQRQVETLGNVGDILIAYSTSGNSKNICMAAEAAKSKGMKVIAFAGNHKNMAIDPLSDITFKSPAIQTPLIQEIHTIAGHEICSNVERILFNFQ
jgi:D-sedoheptulose 7-phosphate isomerase|tara:strand:- start:69 stop:665 length:597 start_codon:yes stop_codon:yes gene_type:complete